MTPVPIWFEFAQPSAQPIREKIWGCSVYFRDKSLIELTNDKIQVLPEGKMLIRNICMVFDIYLKENKEQRFSKVI